MRLRETNETKGDYWTLMRLRDSWGLMRLKQTTGDSRDSGRLMETHETQVD